jgi:ankyrin repeat protein
VRYGHTSVVEALLAAGASLETRDWNGRTVLHRAARAGNVEVVATLLRHGTSTWAGQSGWHAGREAQQQQPPGSVNGSAYIQPCYTDDMMCGLWVAGCRPQDKDKHGKSALAVSEDARATHCISAVPLLGVVLHM